MMEKTKRKKISGSPLSGFLSVVLSEIQNPLQYLSLQSCSLTDSNLNYLANSKHVSVEHLDLSENRLNRYADDLMGLLRKCSPNLKVLELDDNRFDCIDYLTLVCADLYLMLKKPLFQQYNRPSMRFKWELLNYTK